MLNHYNIEDALFIDIETVPMARAYHDLRDDFKELWRERFQKSLLPDETIDEQFSRTAGIYAEFGKVICISIGYIRKDGSGKPAMRISSLAGNEERKILIDFADMLSKHYNDRSKYFFCGHNINEFDIPYLCRRMLIHGICLPVLMDYSGMKPWEIKNVDTMQHWKFGDYKSYTSLKLLSALFDIPTPKDDISGKDVGRIYWQEHDLNRIIRYCEKDVLTVAQLFLRFKGMPLLQPGQVTFVDKLGRQ